MQKKYYNVGTASEPTPYLSAFAAFESTIQGAGLNVMNIGILGLNQEIKEGFQHFVENRFYEYLGTNVLFVTEGGDVLARYIEPEWVISDTRLEPIFNARPIPLSAVGEIAEVFLKPLGFQPEEIEVNAQFAAIIREASSKLAELISKNPNALLEIEWRDLERMMAEVFNGIGFETILTPPSKDKGRDIILFARLSNGLHTYIVELKHWLSLTKVGEKPLRQFINVVVKEERTGGLFLSTLGYTSNAFEAITEIERKLVKFGDKEKIVSLCRTYQKAKSGLMIPKDYLPTVLYEGI